MVVFMAYRIVVTEVTLYGRLRRVAGFELDRGVMIRPEPAAAGFWEARVCGPNTTFHPGHVVEFRGERPQTALPHNTEDIVVGGAPRRIAVLSADGFRQALKRAAAFSPETVFGDHLRFDGDKAYVPAGAACGSLACQTVDAVDFRLFEHAYKDEHKLRAELKIGGRVLRLAVAAKALKQAFEKEGLAAARDLAPKVGRAQVRLGLARPFKDHPDQCYLQVNGLYAL
jgi:hypothetical protein